MIVLADSFRRPSSFDIQAIGVGLGHRTFNRANLLRIFLLGNNANSHNEKLFETPLWEEVISQQAWIDDASPEDISFLVDRLRGLDALEVITQSIQMKKRNSTTKQSTII